MAEVPPPAAAPWEFVGVAAVVAALVWWVVVRPERRTRRDRLARLTALSPGDSVTLSTGDTVEFVRREGELLVVRCGGEALRVRPEWLQ